MCGMEFRDGNRHIGQQLNGSKYSSVLHRAVCTFSLLICVLYYSAQFKNFILDSTRTHRSSTCDSEVHMLTLDTQHKYVFTVKSSHKNVYSSVYES